MFYVRIVLNLVPKHPGVVGLRWPVILVVIDIADKI